MQRTSPAHLFMTMSFLAIIGSVWLIQATVDWRRGERPTVSELFAKKPTAANLRAFEASLEETSWIIRQTRPWTQYAQYVLLKDAGEKALVGREGWMFYKPSVRYFIGKNASGEPAIDEMEPLRAIVSFRDQLAARGIHLLLVPVPNKESIYPEMLTRRARPGSIMLCQRTRRLFEQLRTAGVEVVDLFEEFREYKRSVDRNGGQSLYLVQDSHWSPAGVELAARAVARRAVERGWIAPGKVEYENKPAPVRRVGDVLRMLRSDWIEQSREPEAVRCVQMVRRDNGTMYRDEPTAEVLVLGDSFLRIFQNDEPTGAGFIAHLAKELRQPVASIVSDGGASTLVRQDLHRRANLLANTKLVVWEFVERDIRFGTEGWQVLPLPALAQVGTARE